MRTLYAILFSALVTFSVDLKAQPGALDLSFDPGLGVSGGSVLATCIQPDGKIILGGDFSSYDQYTRYMLVRVNADGSCDTNFNIGTGADWFIRAIAVQSDGKIVIGGMFNMFDGHSAMRIARLNSDGSFDTTFNTGTGMNDIVYDIAIQPDGKIIAAGQFNFVNNVYNSRIVRLNTDGSVDTTFYSGNNGVNDNINSVTIQPNGMIIIGGGFTQYDGNTAMRVARLNIDGSLDGTFNAGTGADAAVNKVLLQPDGKILIAGYFYSYNGSAFNQVARIEPNGDPDTTFDPGTGTGGAFVPLDMDLQADGKIVIGGPFLTFNSSPHKYIVRLDPQGYTDNSFATDSAFNSGVTAVEIQSNGKIIVGGGFWMYDSISRRGVARLIDDCTPSTATSTISTCVSYTAPDGVVYTSSGNYTAIIQNASGCDSTITINLTIIPVDTSMTQNGVTLTANAIGATYQWIDCISGNVLGTSQSFTPPFDGLYGLVVTQNSCTDSSNCHLITGVGIEENTGFIFNISPNPVQSQFMVSLPFAHSYIQATITDVSGRVVKSETYNNVGSFDMNVSELNSGIYFITVMSGSSQSTQLFIRP